MVIHILVDLTNKRFGRLKVLCRAEDFVSKSGKHRTRWLCQCDCGNTVIIYSDNLKRGKSTSCGCYRNECTRKRSITHGETKTKLYGVWSSIKSRCYNSNTTAFKDYGGRGIIMCDDWKDSFEIFKDWAYKNGYRDGLSIDRINNNSGYNPDNCRWVVSDVQANNRRNNNSITFNGETHTVTEWAKIMNKNPKTIFSRIYTGWNPIDAITK